MHFGLCILIEGQFCYMYILATDLGIGFMQVFENCNAELINTGL